MKAKIRLWLFIFVSSILLFNIVVMGNNNDLPPEIFKHWIHSHEEDTKDIKVFRPSDYNFPLSWSRDGFEIKENGEFVQYRPSPTDRLEKFTGHWKAKGRDKINVYFKNNETSFYTINIISCSKDILKIKK